MNSEAIYLLNDFLDKFELNLKDDCLEENLLKSLENNKIKIFTSLNNSTNPKFIKVYISKVWNICRMLNYTRNIKDTDKNYYLLRLKDFLCDMYFLIFSSMSEISLNDVFNLIQLVTDVGSQWAQLEMKMSIEGWSKKLDHIMKYLISKIIDLENLISLEKKFYVIFIDYVNFYIQISIISYLNESQIRDDLLTDKNEEIIKTLILIKNIKFLENDISTRNLVTNLLNCFKLYDKSKFSSKKENVLFFCQTFNSLKFKNLLTGDLMTQFYKFYINKLLENNYPENAEVILKNLFEFVTNNSVEELDCFFLNLEISLKYLNSSDKLKDILEIILDHRELTMEYFEDLMIISCNYKIFNIFLEVFLTRLKCNKNQKLFLKENNNIQFNFETFKYFKIFSFLFLYNFFKSDLFIQLSNSSEIFTNNLNSNGSVLVLIHELLKILSESLLDNFEAEMYDEEQTKIIPDLLKNIVLFFLRTEKSNENFSSYFLIEIIKKIKNPEKEKEFVELSLELYIAKKDFIKLKNLVNELEAKNITNSLLVYSNIIIIIKEGNKWNSHNIINNLCSNLNKTEGFNIIYYLKIFNFLMENKVSDFSTINSILLNFTIVFFDLVKNSEYEKIKYEDKTKNKILSFFEILYEVISFLSRLSNFPQQVSLLVDFLNFLGSSMEFETIKENSHLITNDFLTVLEIINILLNYKNINNLGQSKNVQDYPEFILIFCCKMLNFIFNNFSTFQGEFFNIESSLVKEQIKHMCELFDLYNNLSIFNLSYDYTSITEERNSELVENDIDQNEENIEMAILNNKVSKLTNLLQNFELFENNIKNSFLTFKSKFSNDLESCTFIEEKAFSLNKSTKTILLVLKIQILSKIRQDEWFEEFILALVNDNMENKKLLLMINSIIYQSGMKILSSKFVKKIINNILSMFAEFVPKFYSVEDLVNLNRDFVNLVGDDTKALLISLKEFSSLTLKLNGRVDEMLVSENVEWTLYKINTLLEGSHGNNKIQANENDFALLRQIFEDLCHVQIKNKSFVLVNLFEIIKKKLIA